VGGPARVGDKKGEGEGYAEGETIAVRKMDSFEDGEDIGASTDERDDSMIGNVTTLDQSNPLQFFQMKTEFKTTYICNPHTRSQVQVSQPRTMSRQLYDRQICDFRTMSQMQIMQILAQCNEGHNPPIGQRSAFIEHHVPDSWGVGDKSHEIGILKVAALR
jgi:hypothetical protein